MSRGDTFDADRELDVRTLSGPPFGPILEALDDLQAEETLVLVNSFEPEPLYDLLDDRGFAHRTEQVADDEWRVAIEHAE